MGNIPTTTATKLPEGAKVVTSKAIGPVKVVRARTVGIDKQTIEFQLEQEFESPVNGQGGVLGLTMKGHTAFNSGPRKRVVWQNFSTIQAIRHGLIRDWDEVANSVLDQAPTPSMPQGQRIMGAMAMNKDLILKDERGNVIPVKLVEWDSFEQRKWVDRSGQPQEQRPKTAGNGGDLLLHNGKKIYRNTGLSIPGAGDAQVGREWDQDVVIMHNNTVVGSAVREAMGKAGIVIPTTPGSPEARPNADLQNAGPGQTSNILRATPEPTRHHPDEQTQDVAEKTEAERLREEQAHQ